MFRHRTVLRTAVALVGVAALTLGACTDDAEPDFEGTLEVGVILPQTGELAFVGPAQTAGVELAQADINEAGGVWGSDVSVEFGDEGDATDETVATASADALIQAGVDAVIGASATARTLSIIEPLRDAGILLVSPASPGIALDEHPARDRFLRVMPSDVIQGAALGEEIAADGHERIAIVARDDAYGQGLAGLTAQRYEAAVDPAEAEPTPGPTPEAPEETEREVVADVRYDPDEPDLAAAVAEIVAAEPEAVVIVSFEEESAELMTALADAELGPADDSDDAAGTQWYLINGNLADYSDELPDGAVEGVKAAAPAPAAEAEDLYERMDEHTPELTDHAYGAEAYDALTLLALGAVVANTDDPAEIRSAMIDASRGPGTACGTYADCLALIEAGDEIDYQGQSGAIGWSDAGDPQEGSVGIYEYGADNTFTRVRVQPVGI